MGTLWSAVATRAVGAADLPAGEPQPVEGLRRGDLVDEVEVDVDQPLADLVGVPDLVEQRLGIAHQPLLSPAATTARNSRGLGGLVGEVVRQVGVEGDAVARGEVVALVVDQRA